MMKLITFALAIAGANANSDIVSTSTTAAAARRSSFLKSADHCKHGSDGVIITVHSSSASPGSSTTSSPPPAAPPPASEVDNYQSKLLDRIAHTPSTLASGSRVDRAFHLVPALQAHLNDQMLSTVFEDDEVETVEANCVIALDDLQSSDEPNPPPTQSSPPWNLDRIDSCHPDCASDAEATTPALDNAYTWGTPPSPPGGTSPTKAGGAGATVYVLDTGIRTSHVDFGSRAQPGWSAGCPTGTEADCSTNGGKWAYQGVITNQVNRDVGRRGCSSHGTHCAGTAGGATYGVAKEASLVSVQVLSCQGSGDSAGVIAGIEWAVQDAYAKAPRGAVTPPAVISMSLGGGAVAAEDAAVRAAHNAGVLVVAAAGNSDDDACAYSPARAPEAITVAASTRSDNKAGFSSYGTCVDIWAPGKAVVSAGAGSNTEELTYDGTSMATPAVAGVIAQMKALRIGHADNATETTEQLLCLATPGAIDGVGRLDPPTPNKLLRTGASLLLDTVNERANRCGWSSLSAPPAPPRAPPAMPPPPAPPAPPPALPPPPKAPSMWTILTGADYCEISHDGACVSDGNGEYGNNEHCELTPVAQVTVSATEFSLEENYDFVTIDEQRFTGTAGPSDVRMTPGAILKWQSDGSVTSQGFTVCATLVGPSPPAPPSPPPAPPSPPAPPAPPPSPPDVGYWSVTAGTAYCELINGGRCVTDGADRYGNNEACVVTVKDDDLVVSATEFKTEKNFDAVIIGNTRYHGNKGPSGVHIAAGATLRWQSDVSITDTGFVICAEKATSSPSPPPPAAPPSPPAPPPPASPPPATPAVQVQLYRAKVRCGSIPKLKRRKLIRSFEWNKMGFSGPAVGVYNHTDSATNNPTLFNGTFASHGNWAARLRMPMLRIETAGTYLFHVSLGDADTAALWVNGVRVLQTGCVWACTHSSVCRPGGYAVPVDLLAGVHALELRYADGGWGDRAIVTYSGPDTNGEARGIPAGAPGQAVLDTRGSLAAAEDDDLLDDEGDDEGDDDDEDDAFPDPPASTPTSPTGHSQTSIAAVSEELRWSFAALAVAALCGGAAVCALLLLGAAIEAAIARRQPRTKADVAAAAAAVSIKVDPTDIESAGESPVAERTTDADRATSFSSDTTRHAGEI